MPTAREAHYVLDDLLGNTTDLPISQHATDTHGVTLVNFALFDLVGKALTPGSGIWAGSPSAGTTPRKQPPPDTPARGRCSGYG